VALLVGLVAPGLLLLLNGEPHSNSPPVLSQ
jgi:hypothetical protein